MPDSMHLLDAGLPRFKGSESTEDKVAAIQNYLYMLLEELRYILRHLGAENFTSQGAQEVVEQALGADVESIATGGESVTNVFETIVANTIISNSFYTSELYSTYGEVADLTVWRLRTDYMRAQNYLRGSRADINYIDIHEEQMDFITGRYSGGPVQLVRDGMAFYWTDATKTHMTFLTATAWPVMVYEYTEDVKLSIRFSSFVTTQGVSTYAPVFILGAGDENGRNKAVMSKDQEGLNFILTATNGDEVGLRANANTGKLTLYGYDGHWFGTQAEYDAITTKDPDVIYFVEASS